MQKLKSSPTHQKNNPPKFPPFSLFLSLHKWRISLLLLHFLNPMSSHNYFSNLGFGYSIAIALAFLVLLSTLILSSYFCCRRSHRRNNNPNPIPNPNYIDGVVLPRDIFVAVDDEEDQNFEEYAAMGLDDNVINSYPRFQFSREGSVVGQNTTCSICLCEFKDSEMLRMMPECRHYFHVCCLDSWLKLKGSCPVCRNSPLPTPLSTPLQEVVPLSQYADDRSRTRR